ncbi:MAG: S1/P1 nuclease [Acidobacteriota bacterium]|nr:S1/P1 nuclease [Acidobacteriota bacterium]
MLKIIAKVFLIILPILTFTFSAAAWDDAGHKISAYIAWQRMSPEAREKAAKILLAAPEDSDLSVFYLQDSRSAATKQRELFMIASTWADIVRDRKFKERYDKYHKGNWHYSDTFWQTVNGKTEYLKDMEEGGKAVEKLYDFEKVLRDNSASDEDKAIALAWILHLGGDIHQPLHTSARVTELEPKGDQGGNLFLLTPKDTQRSENLHWFWDSIVGGNIPRQNDACDSDYLPPLAASFVKKHPFAKMQNRLALGQFDEWQKQSFALNQTAVFSPDLIRYQTPSAKYKKKAFTVAEQQLALAGYRLGEMLDQIFGGKQN